MEIDYSMSEQAKTSELVRIKLTQSQFSRYISLGYPLKGCKGKIKHKTPQKAELSAIRTARINGAEMNYYFCFICEYYHVGHVTNPIYYGVELI